MQDAADVEKLNSAKLKKAGKKEGEDGEKQGQVEDVPEDQKVEIEGEKVVTSTVPRGPQSSFHTTLEHLNTIVSAILVPVIFKLLNTTLILTIFLYI